MKLTLIIISLLAIVFLVFQIYTTMTTSKTESQPYSVVKVEKTFEIRYYPAAVMAKITSTSSSYRDLGYSGFSMLAQYIFGGNSEHKQIAMTSPVHMDIGDSMSTMSFVMPSSYQKDSLPKPNNADIVIETTEPEYVAVITFGGFGGTASINKHKALLEDALKDKGLTYYGNFRYLGYNPPYQLFGRKNEVIVALNTTQFD